MASSKDMRLKIMACRQVYHGRNQKGDEYTIYEIDASNPAGKKIEQKLRAFQPLPIGQEVDVTVTPFDSELHGRSYTLQVKGRAGGGGSAQQVNDLWEAVEELRHRNAALQERVAALEADKTVAIKAEMGAQPTNASSVAASKFGEDAPW